ncbi:MAG: hypothetical protein WCG99_01930 [Candidatus Berkelbacteria bacterium]
MPPKIGVPELTLEQIVREYNRFSLHDGWIANPQPNTTPEGHHGIRVIGGSWSYTDAWVDGRDSPIIFDEDVFMGQTILSCGKWMAMYMTYHGRMDAIGTEMVKLALRYQYELGIFNGGRGPATFEDGDLRYMYELTTDHPNKDMGVVGFSGREAVYDKDDHCHAQCFIQGGVLIPGFADFQPTR